MRFDFFVKLKCQTSIVIVSLGIEYSMSDAICREAGIWIFYQYAYFTNIAA